MLTAGALSLLASRWLFAAAPLPAASSRWCSLPAGCLPCRSLLPCPLSTVFCGAPRPAASLPLRRPCQQLFPMALCIRHKELHNIAHPAAFYRGTIAAIFCRDATAAAGAPAQFHHILSAFGILQSKDYTSALNNAIGEGSGGELSPGKSLYCNCISLRDGTALYCRLAVEP